MKDMQRPDTYFKDILDHVLEGCQIIGADWRYLYVNDVAAQHGRKEKSELLGHRMMDVYPGIDATPMFETLARCMATRATAKMLNEFVYPDGSKRWFELSVQPVPEGLCVMSLDITEHRRAEAALRENEERFRSLYENSTVGLYRTTPDGRIVLANPTLLEMMGYSSFDELSTRDLEKDGYEPSYERVHFLEAIEKESEVKGLESAWKRRDGTAIFVRESARAIRDPQGKTLYYDGTVEDITARKQAEEVINSLARFPSENPNPVLRIDRDGRLLYANAASYTLLTWQLDIGQPAPAVLQEMVAETFTERASKIIDTEHSQRAISFFVAPVVEAGYANLYGRDITERRRTEQALRASEERYRTTIMSVGDGVIATDTEGRVELLNPVAEALTGWRQAEARGKPLEEVFRIINEETRQTVENPVRRVMREGLVVGLANHSVLTAKDGTEYPIADSGAPIRDEKGEITGVVLVFRDQTQERAAQKALRESEQRLRRFYESGLVGVIFWNMHGQIMDANDKFLELVGYTRDELAAGRIDWVNMTPPEYRHLDDSSVAELKATGVNRTPFEKEYIRKDGTRIPIMVAGAMLDEARFNGVAFVVDITERKRAEEALSASERRFRLAAESLTDVIYEWDLKDKVEWYGDIDGVMGYPTGGFPRTLDGWAATLHPADKERVMAAVDGQLKRAAPYNVEYRVRKKDGEWRWWSARGTALRDERGEPYWWIGSITDITERQRAEQALRESESKFRSLFENMTEGVALHEVIYNEGNVAVNYRILSVNLAYEKHTGLKPEQVEGGLASDVYGTEEPPYLELYARVASSGQPYSFEPFFPPMDKYFHISVSSPKPGHFVTVFEDITDRKRAEEEIRRLNAELEDRVVERTAQLEASNKELEAFAYSVSHDLRAPLRAIDGFSRIILEEYADRLDAEGDRLLKIVRDNTQKMDRLITDLLALTRVSRSEMRSSRIDMTTLANSIYHEMVSPEVQEKFTFSVSPLADAYGDPTLLRQVWSNLLSNAIKYTLPKAERRIEVGGYTEKGMNVYTVTDSGVGFNPDYAHKLFGVFQRLHKAEEFEGTGVGLVIVQRIIQRHGGQVWAEGQVNEGATFYFSLPQPESAYE